MADGHLVRRWRAALEVAGADALASALLPAALAVSALVLLWRLLSEPFDHGYLRHAILAAEMVRSGDWIVQRHAGQPYFDKPPFPVWLIAAAMRLAGSSSGWVQHAPSAIGWLAALGFTFAFGRRWFGQRRAALAASLVLVTSLGFLFQVREKRIDPLFTAWLTGSLYFAYRFLVDAASRRQRWSLALAASALLVLATLTKGPLALLFFGLVIGSFSMWTGRVRRLVGPEGVAASVLLLALVALWPILVLRELGLAQTLEALRATKLTTRVGGPFLYVEDLALRFLPWTLLWPAIGAWLVRSPSERESLPLRFILCWVSGVLIPLQLSEARHYRYLLPLFPALALLAVAPWYLTVGRPAADRGGASPARLEALGLGSLLAALVAVSVIVPIALWIEMRPEWRVGSAVAPAWLGVGLVSFLALRRVRRERIGAFETAVAAVALAVATYDGARALELAAGGVQSEAARAALAAVTRGAPARSFGLRPGERDALSLTTPKRVDTSRSVEAVATWLRGTEAGRGFVVTNEEGERQLATLAGIATQHREPIALARHALVVLELSLAAPPETPATGAGTDRT